ncbi:class F sortase [Pseudonocardia sp.]|uniref:class F sortase n=1 Tax=Pseudonocardia sp. TaxID=60912 RepID=UPI003D115978
MSHRIRRAAIVLAMTAALAGCGTGPTPVPGNAPVSAPVTRVAIPPLATSKPVGLIVPAIGVDSGPLLDLGLDPAGKLEVPPDAKDVGWFDLSPTPGALGPAILAAHVDWKGVAGPFQKLSELRVGDEVRVKRADGTTAVFETYDVLRYPKDQFPTDEVYGDTTDAEIRLITCGGEFDSGSGHYRDNVVAFARLVASA